MSSLAISLHLMLWWFLGLAMVAFVANYLDRKIKNELLEIIGRHSPETFQNELKKTLQDTTKS